MSGNFLVNLDRRFIYLAVLLALSVPLIAKYTIKPARMEAAEKLFDVVQKFDGGPDKIAFVAMDFGPSTIAENGSQAEVTIEHLLRRKIPFAVFSMLPESAAILNDMPERVAKRLMVENPGERYQYGNDWVNLGYLAGGFIAIQSIPKAEDLRALFKKDVRGNNLTDLPAFKQVKTLKNIGMLVEITGSVGVLETYLQFFQTEDYRPIFAHGCTSITTPQAYIYLDSGQLQALFEGIAGAAWYSELLKENFPGRAVDNSAVRNTALGVAHLVIIALVILGNIVGLIAGRAK